MRVTRNGWCATISMPGNSWSRCAAMTCSSGTNRSPSGRRTNRGSSGGTFTRANRRSPVHRVAHDHRQVQRQVRDVGERVRRGRPASGVSTGKIRSLEHLDEVRRGRRRRASSQPTSGSRPRPAPARRSSRNTRSWRSTSSRTRSRIAAQLLARASARRARCAPSAGGELVLEPGDADLEELVEVLAEDGQELGPLEQRHAPGPRPGPGPGR